jgi:hypothetical protein
MRKDISFTNIFAEFEELEKPVLSSSELPEWYKNTDSYVEKQKRPNGQGGTSGTIKRCVPVFDAITAGYIIKLPADVYVSIKDEDQYFEWASPAQVGFHPITQAPQHPEKNGFAYPKWINPWAIRTPKGYSCLFVQPFHRDSVFSILPGIVDTDKYYAPVNFPFVIKDPTFEGLIPKGTPIAQVIPFKRDFWTKTIGTKKDIHKITLLIQNFNTKFFDKYKTMFWEKKQYK